MLVACYDGKLGRAVPADIVQKRGCFIEVAFPRYDDPRQRISGWFGPQGAAYVKVDGHSVHKTLFGLKGDYYRLYKTEYLDKDIKKMVLKRVKENAIPWT
jgi:hypothetical protein